MDFNGNNPKVSSGYGIPSSIRVRKEPFGLLFYNTQDAKLTFVRSGNALQIAETSKGRNIIWAANESPDRINKLKKLFEILLRKGLIIES